MNIYLNFLRVLMISFLIAWGTVVSEPAARQPIDPVAAKLGKGFISGTAKVN